MKIALIGTRGIPARYGGFETCVEELGRRLSERGHSITVYGRSGLYPEKPKTHSGMTPVYLPSLNVRFLETLSNTFLALLHSLPRKFDVTVIFNNANSPLVLIAKMFGKPLALHTDGLEWKRGKWSSLGRRYFRATEKLAARLGIPLISDSRKIQDYYRTTYGKDSVFIPYGAEPTQSTDPGRLAPFRVEPGEYFLQITRFEPENNPDLTLRAFEALDTDKKLVLVGGVRYPTAYSRAILEAENPRIERPGFIYNGASLNELFCNCYAYIHGNEVGGTNPALLQAMAAGCFVISRDVPFNREVLGPAGIYFEKSSDSLRARMQWALDHPDEIGGYAGDARARILDLYSWDGVVDAYEALFTSLLNRRGGRSLA